MMDRRRNPIVKAKFEPWEDARLLDVVRARGSTNWQDIAAYFPGRNARQCRERWTNYVNPALLKSEWTEAEDQVLLQTYREIGPKWFVIASLLPGRAKNSVKNRYFALERRMDVQIGNRSEYPGVPQGAAPAALTQPQPSTNGTNDALPHSNSPQYDPMFDWDLDHGDGFGDYFWEM
jgi:hypothetical protein